MLANTVPGIGAATGRVRREARTGWNRASVENVRPLCHVIVLIEWDGLAEYSILKIPTGRCWLGIIFLEKP